MGCLIPQGACVNGEINNPLWNGLFRRKSLWSWKRCSVDSLFDLFAQQVTLTTDVDEMWMVNKQSRTAAANTWSPRSSPIFYLYCRRIQSNSSRPRSYFRQESIRNQVVSCTKHTPPMVTAGSGHCCAEIDTGSISKPSTGSWKRRAFTIFQ
jgi:hypothetical protein